MLSKIRSEKTFPLPLGAKKSVWATYIEQNNNRKDNKIQ
jgi:hypothetical protein